MTKKQWRRKMAALDDALEGGHITPKEWRAEVIFWTHIWRVHGWSEA